MADVTTEIETEVAAPVTVIIGADLPAAPAAEAVETTEEVETEGEGGEADDEGAAEGEPEDQTPAPVAVKGPAASAGQPKGKKELPPEPRDINQCTVSMHVVILPPQGDGPRLAMLSATTHDDEPVTSMMAFTGDFQAIGVSLAGVYERLVAQMPARAAANQTRKDAAAAKAAADKARLEAKSKKAQAARTAGQGAGPAAAAAAKRAAAKPPTRQQTLLDVPDLPGGAMVAPATEATVPPAAAVPVVVAPVTAPAPEIVAPTAAPAAAPVAAAAPSKPAKSRAPRKAKAAPATLETPTVAAPVAQAEPVAVEPAEPGSLEARVNGRLMQLSGALVGIAQPKAPADQPAPAPETAPAAAAPAPVVPPAPAPAEGVAGQQINLFGF